jgi:outer membrane receptor protein involved in Fe transport
LQQIRLQGLFQHPSGFFSSAEALWHAQSNHGYTPSLEGDDFWQFNIYAGWRFARRHAEVRLGVLNATDQNYRLNPLNLTADLPRERTFTVRFRFYF